MSDTEHPNLVRALLLPALSIFIVPVFGLWFAHHVEAGYDDDVRASVLQGFAAEGEHTVEEKAQAEAFAQNVTGSLACASTDPELANFKRALGSACNDYLMFFWMQRLALGSIVVGLLTGALIVGASAAASSKRELQVPAFGLTWNLLRVAGALQVVAQGVLIVALSYWVTAWWFNIYVPKLILVAAMLAAVAVFSVLKAIFTKIDLSSDVDGRLIDESAAPHFWARLRALAERVGTEPPARVIGGIDDNFFVTEGTIRVQGQPYEGRSLFVSLALLRGLSAAEAEAVLCHELAHFSGGDTAHSRKLAPMRARYVRYLVALRENPLGLPVFYVMVAFWELFSLALAKTSRERELRADRIAAEQTRPDAVARSLLKVAAWSRYRGEVERDLFMQDTVLEDIAISDRVRAGFGDFARSSRLAEIRATEIPHPLDSHPRNAERMAALGVSLPETTWGEVLVAPVEDSWYDRIPVAPKIEAELWAEYERHFAANQRFRLAVEMTPVTPEQVAFVEEFFPKIQFPDKSGNPSVTMDWAGLQHADWSEKWADVKAPSIEDGMTGKYLKMVTPSATRTIKLRALSNPDSMLEHFQRYLGRAQVAAQKVVEPARV